MSATHSGAGAEPVSPPGSLTELVHEGHVSAQRSFEQRLELAQLIQRLSLRLVVLLHAELVAQLLQILKLRQETIQLILNVRTQKQGLHRGRAGANEADQG